MLLEIIYNTYFFFFNEEIKLIDDIAVYNFNEIMRTIY